MNPLRSATTVYLAACVLCVAVKPADAAEKPNIVIILVDDMGYGDPGCFNKDSKIPTPNIDRLAAEGMMFTDAHASGPLCHMSRYGLMTGQYPFRTKVGVWPRQPLIKSGQETIASLLKSQGYRTAMVGKWHCGFKEDGYDKPLPGGPVHVGFDSFFGIRASTDIPPYFYIRDDKAVSPPTNTIEANYSDGWSKIQGAFWRKGGIAPDLDLENVLPRFTDVAIDVITSHKDRDEPLMLYLAYPAPHTPWLPSPEFAGKSGASMYGDFAMMVDAMIGKVLKSLDDTGLAKDTLVFFTSDNGPVWYDADVKRFDHDSVGGLRGMKADAWEGGHRMPFIARWPNRIEPGSQSDQLISFVDFLATFADLTDADLKPDAGPDSFSFLPVLTGRNADSSKLRKQLVLRSGAGAMMMRDGDWKYIDRLGSGGFTKPNRIKPKPDGPKAQLFDLKNDRGESTNLFLQRPDVVKRLKNELTRLRDSQRTRPE